MSLTADTDITARPRLLSAAVREYREAGQVLYAMSADYTAGHRARRDAARRAMGDITAELRRAGHLRLAVLLRGERRTACQAQSAIEEGQSATTPKRTARLLRDAAAAIEEVEGYLADADAVGDNEIRA